MRSLRAALTAGAVALLTGAALVVGAAPASAHPMPHSVVLLDVHPDRIEAQVALPVDDLHLASGLDAVAQPEQVITRDGDAVRAYLAGHVRPATDGVPWTVSVADLSVRDAEQTATGPYREVVAHLLLRPPSGLGTRRFTFAYDAVVHQVVTHTVLVALRTDWATGRVGADGVGEDGRELGVIAVDSRTMTVAPLPVDLDSGGAWEGFLGMLRLGGHHIAEGTDHLLFLLTLLLPAPLLLTTRRRWGGPAGPRRAAAAIGRITLAFTVGHSVTLALSALGRIDIPARPVEAAIAASILVSAVHAVRPLFPGREALIAGLFGLVHGMAFSFTLAELDLSTFQLVVSLLGFNLGIELVQLLVVALVLPPLVVLARADVAYRVLRIGGASIAGIAALGWLADRLDAANPVATAADTIGAHGWWVVAALWLAALTVLGRSRPVLGTVAPWAKWGRRARRAVYGDGP
jgi:HupE / UreJ protein